MANDPIEVLFQAEKEAGLVVDQARKCACAARAPPRRSDAAPPVHRPPRRSAHRDAEEGAPRGRGGDRGLPRRAAVRVRGVRAAAPLLLWGAREADADGSYLKLFPKLDYIKGCKMLGDTHHGL